MGTTLVHIADVHLETVFPDVRGGSARRAALADAFERAIDLAIARKADALTIAGDLYEAERAGPQTARFLFAAFARFGKPVFIAPGNHDPNAARAIYARDDLPRNVHVFADASWSAVPLADDLTLYGFAHTAGDPGRPFACPPFDLPGTRIALVHGSDEQRCPPGKNPTAPFTPAEIRAAGATVALCGHYHGGYVHTDEAGPVLAYPGSLEPIKFGERNVHGALVVRIDGPRVKIEQVPLARTRLIEVDVSLDGIGDEHAALAACDRALAGYGATDYVRVTLHGAVEPGTRIDRALFAERCGAALGALEVVDRTLSADYAALGRQQNVRGRAIAELLASSDPDAERAMALVVAAFDGAEMHPVKLRTLALAGFGRLARAHFAFDDGLTVIYGPNEAGKSTIAAAIVASLYGLARGARENWRPWVGDPYASTLLYELADGRTFEIQRDYHKDAKGVKVYNGDGNDVAGELANGRTVSPGETHLQISLDAFVNAACVRQQAVAIDGDRSGAVATALARALDGGPKDDAALGAIARLVEARRQFVGTSRATVNTPLRSMAKQLYDRETELTRLREQRDRLAGVRERRAAAIAERDRVEARRAGADRDLRAIRAAELRDRLDQLREYREELEVRDAERARYDDVAAFPAERVMDELERAFVTWDNAENAAQNAEDDAAAGRVLPEEETELEALAAGPGTISEVEFATLREAAYLAESARGKAHAAANVAAIARRDGSGGRSIAGAVLAVAIVAVVLTIAFAIAHWWALTETIFPIAAIASGVVAVRARNRMMRARVAERKQRAADEALANEQAAASAVAAVLDRFHLSSVEELGRKRERLSELRRKTELAERSASRADAARAEERTFAVVFDALADELIPDVLASRIMRRQIAHERAARRRQRDGIDNAIAMLALRRGEILRGADEFTLVSERDDYAAAGIIAAEEYVTGRDVELAGQVHEFERLSHEADITIAALSTELDLGEVAVGDLAALEEEVTLLRAEVTRLEAFDRAIVLAYATVERITRETHRAFARRLESYAADALGTITAGRYGELHVDPKTLAVRVRVPETKSIENLDQLSAGTRDQIYLIVRFAMARMFAEGLETPPLLLDDPFAFWDEARIERCLPLVAQNAFSAQTLLFTSSAELAAAATTIGAARIDLAPAEAVTT